MTNEVNEKWQRFVSARARTKECAQKVDAMKSALVSMESELNGAVQERADALHDYLFNSLGLVSVEVSGASYVAMTFACEKKEK